MSEIQSEGYHDPARHWDELHSSERFRPTYPGEPVVRFLMAGFRDRLQAGTGLPRSISESAAAGTPVCVAS